MKAPAWHYHCIVNDRPGRTWNADIVTDEEFQGRRDFMMNALGIEYRVFVDTGRLFIYSWGSPPRATDIHVYVREDLLA